MRIDVQTCKCCESELRFIERQRRGFEFEPTVPTQSGSFETFRLLLGDQDDEIERAVERETAHLARGHLSAEEAALLDRAREAAVR